MANLSKTERRRAIESVRDVIRAVMFDDAAGSTYEVECCPRCGSVTIVKKGKPKNGEQRYLCRDCGRTFGMGSERILGTSKLPKETWMAYAECFVLMLPLRECARCCHVCLETAYTMRHRLIECLSAYSPSFKVERGRIMSGSVVATDKASAYVDVLGELEVAVHAAYDSKDRSEGTINWINTVHSLLSAFMEPFRGVSTKHLDAYLALFKWCRTFIAADSDTAERTVARQLANGVCRSRVHDMFNILPPYMDYWGAPTL